MAQSCRLPLRNIDDCRSMLQPVAVVDEAHVVDGGAVPFEASMAAVDVPADDEPRPDAVYCREQIRITEGLGRSRAGWIVKVAVTQRRLVRNQDVDLRWNAGVQLRQVR